MGWAAGRGLHTGPEGGVSRVLPCRRLRQASSRQVLHLLKNAKLEILEVWLLLLLLALPSLFQPQEPQPIILDLQQGFPHLYLQDLRCPHKKCTLVE